MRTVSPHYYNEWEPYAAAWLRNLTASRRIPAGKVDEKSIKDVQEADIERATQAHFFAGIGGWPLALQLAGWPADLPVWTGSCPCQPFSVAGKGLGTADERHLWPEFFRLISECRPSVVFGEQVASAAGRVWLAGVRADLEKLGYAVGGADLCAASVSAPHRRQRLWWVADLGLDDATSARREAARKRAEGQARDKAWMRGPEQRRGSRWGDEWVSCSDGKSRRLEPGLEPLAHGVPARVGKLRAYGNAISPWVAAEFVMAYMET
jgi:DNA (cytosine-5)-methyltransferase 1